MHKSLHGNHIVFYFSSIAAADAAVRAFDTVPIHSDIVIRDSYRCLSIEISPELLEKNLLPRLFDMAKSAGPVFFVRLDLVGRNFFARDGYFVHYSKTEQELLALNYALNHCLANTDGAGLEGYINITTEKCSLDLFSGQIQRNVCATIISSRNSNYVKRLVEATGANIFNAVITDPECFVRNRLEAAAAI